MPKVTKSPVKIPSNKELTCGACGHLKNVKEYYISYNPVHSTGRIPYCKKCLKKMICNEQGIVELEKLKETLRLIDKPFIYDLWRTSLDDKNDAFGTYMKNLALVQNRQLYWKDSIFQPQLDIELNYEHSLNEQVNDSKNKNEVKINENRNEDKIFSKEWHGFYTQYELDYLDEYLKGLKNDFKIITTNHKDYAKKICQASLAVNKAFQDMTDGIEGAEKRYKDLQDTFDKLSKSAQFSESQRGINDVSLGCFGVIFDKVEKKQWIATHTPLEKDDYDILLEAFSTIKKSV